MTPDDIDSCYRTCAAKPVCQSINFYREKSHCGVNWCGLGKRRKKGQKRSSGYFLVSWYLERSKSVKQLKNINIIT